MALATTVSRSRERLKKLPWVPPETPMVVSYNLSRSVNKSVWAVCKHPLIEDTADNWQGLDETLWVIHVIWFTQIIYLMGQIYETISFSEIHKKTDLWREKPEVLNFAWICLLHVICQWSWANWACRGFSKFHFWKQQSATVRLPVGRPMLSRQSLFTVHINQLGEPVCNDMTQREDAM